MQGVQSDAGDAEVGETKNKPKVSQPEAKLSPAAQGTPMPRRQQPLQMVAGDNGKEPMALCLATGHHLQPQPGPLQLQKDGVMPGPGL